MDQLGFSERNFGTNYWSSHCRRKRTSGDRGRGRTTSVASWRGICRDHSRYGVVKSLRSAGPGTRLPVLGGAAPRLPPPPAPTPGAPFLTPPLHHHSAPLLLA